jgi:hypothetical protein
MCVLISVCLFASTLLIPSTHAFTRTCTCTGGVVSSDVKQHILKAITTHMENQYVIIAAFVALRAVLTFDDTVDEVQTTIHSSIHRSTVSPVQAQTTFNSDSAHNTHMRVWNTANLFCVVGFCRCMGVRALSAFWQPCGPFLLWLRCSTMPVLFCGASVSMKTAQIWLAQRAASRSDLHVCGCDSWLSLMQCWFWMWYYRMCLLHCEVTWTTLTLLRHAVAQCGA